MKKIISCNDYDDWVEVDLKATQGAAVFQSVFNQVTRVCNDMSEWVNPTQKPYYEYTWQDTSYTAKNQLELQDDLLRKILPECSTVQLCNEFIKLCEGIHAEAFKPSGYHLRQVSTLMTYYKILAADKIKEIVRDS